MKKNWQVDIFWEDESIKKKIKERLNFNLEKVNFISGKKSLLKRFFRERSYDLLFSFSDGSVPLMMGKKNILHFQIPFRNVGGRKWQSQIKMKRIDHAVCNSCFTKRFIDQEFGVNSRVIYPPVDIAQLKPKVKENIILAVGRFSQLLQAKRQDILIHEFKQMIKTNLNEYLRGWKLVLAGGTDVGGKEYFNKLKRGAGDYPIEFFENPSFSALKGLYGRAKIFWSAAGFGIDEDKEPERVEHFGITTVEAMAAGCVPIVVGKGGPKEVVSAGKNGFFWDTIEDLGQATIRLASEKDLIERISQSARESSRKFSEAMFRKKFDEIIG